MGSVAQAQSSGTGTVIEPSLTLQETVTSNRDLSSTNPQADAITQVSPGIHISSRSGRVQGSLSYSLNALAYARDSGRNTVQNALTAALTAEAVTNHAFVDASASISQQSVSAFGTQSGGTGLFNGNSTEVSTLSVSPYLRGRLGGFADVTARLNWATSRSSSTGAGDSTRHGGDLGLGGRQGLFGWGLNASRQVDSFDAGSTTTSDQAVASLSFYPDTTLQLSGRAGKQWNDVLTGSREITSTTGWGITWRPTDRTDVSLQGDRTYYGRSHSYALTHRMARSVWSYVDSNAVSSPTSRNSVLPLTLYDLYYAICVAAGGPPAACEPAARSAIAQQGLNPGTVVAAGFLNSSLTVSRNQILSASYAGLRMTTTLSLFRSSTSALGAAAPGSGDLSQGAPVRQQGASLGVSQRLTPSASLSLTGLQQTTFDSGAQPGNRQRTVNLAWSLTPGPHTSLTLSARHTRFTSATNPYTESAAIGSLSLRF